MAYFSYGMMFGCGAGLAFPPGIFIVTSYFVKYRGFANGVAISGSCIGSMFLPPFLGHLIENYGYKYYFKHYIKTENTHTHRCLLTLGL